MSRQYAFLGPNSTKAAEASECAADQGKYWEYRDLVYRNQSQLKAATGTETLKAWAGLVGGIDQAKLNACLDSGQYAEKIRLEKEEGTRAGIPGTPAIYVDGQLVEGASGIPTVEELKAAIDQALAKKGR